MTAKRAARIVATGIGALAVTALAVYLYSVGWTPLYMWHQGVSDPAELSEDYGGAFFFLVGAVAVFIVTLPCAYGVIWRMFNRLMGFAGR